MAFYGGGSVRGALQLEGRSSPGVSPASAGRMYFDSTLNRFLVSENGGAYRAAFTQVASATATTTITTTSTTDILATSMSITPESGTYLVIFSGSASNSSNNQSIFPSVYVDGVQVAASERRVFRLAANDGAPFACVTQATVNGAQAIEGRWRVSAGTGSMYQRTLVLVKVG